MKLFTYYQDCPEISPDDSLRLITLWRQHHAALGFEPFVLTEYHARGHPYFEEFDAEVRKLPTTNPAGYDLACYHRWLAMATVAAGFGIMTDYDLFFGGRLGEIDHLVGISGADMQKLRVYQNIVPCLVVGTAATFLQAATWFAEFPPHAAGKHTSDMYLLEQIAVRSPDLFTRLDYVKQYPAEGWQKAPAIHFATASMGSKMPKWKHIPEIFKGIA